MIDRLDKHQTTVVAKYTYGPEDGSVCLDKNQPHRPDNLQPPDDELAQAKDYDEKNSDDIFV